MKPEDNHTPKIKNIEIKNNIKEQTHPKGKECKN
jgi:hypothetical protein